MHVRRFLSPRYEARTVVGPEGGYRLRVPYATRDAPHGMEIDSAYRIVSGGRSELLEVSEAAVRSGAVVAGPDLGAD